MESDQNGGFMFGFFRRWKNMNMNMNQNSCFEYEHDLPVLLRSKRNKTEQQLFESVSPRNSPIEVHEEIQDGLQSLLALEFLPASVNGNLDTVVVPTSVLVRVAHELLLAGHRYLDVRTPEEFHVGHAPGAINIPYMYRVGSGMTKNANFVKEVSSHFRKDAEIIVGCQLGKRSMMAATDLLAAGFSAITDIAGGYAAWTQNGLPTEQ